MVAACAGWAIALNTGKVPVALTRLREDAGLSLVQAGWIAAMLSSVAVVSAVFVGMGVGRFGALRVAVTGLLLCAAASLWPVLVEPGWWPLASSRFVEGLGFMLVAVSCPALITAASGPGDRRFALSLWSTYMPVGASLIMALAPVLLPTAGWRGLWLLTSLLLVAAAGSLMSQRAAYGSAGGAHPTGPHPGTDRPDSFFGPVREALRPALPWLLAVSFGLWSLQHFALIAWMPTYLQEQRGMGPSATAGLTAFMLMACAPGNLLGGVLVQRGVPRGLLLIAAHIVTGSCAYAYTREAWPDGLRYAAAVAVSFAGGLIPAAVMSSSTVLARTPQQIGTLQGLYMQVAHLGQFFGTPLIAWLVTRHGRWADSLWATGSAAAAGIVLGWVAHRLGQQHVEPP